MKFTDIYESNSEWLKASDLAGTKPIVTIATAEVVENTYDGITKSQIVLTFVDKDKKLGLNFTNASKIAELLDTQDYDDWVGATIKLYTDTTKMKDGRTVPCIRIFPELPEPPTSQVKSKAKGKAAGHDPNDPLYSGPNVNDDPPDDDEIPW